MSDRPKHPRQDLESILTQAERAGWRIIKNRKYYRAYCPCGQHQRSIHLTPSDPNYGKNAGKWFERQDCWEAR